MGNRVHVFDTATIQATKDRMPFFAGFSQERMHSLRAGVMILGHDGEAFKTYKTSYGS
jgi:hypothetical protein